MDNIDDFNQLINRSTDSKAYLDFCEEVYGYRMYLFNMMDKSQLDYLLNSISIKGNDIILDLGCGSGSILNALVNKYQCKGIGIDQLDTEVIRKFNKFIVYINGSIDTLSDYDISPSITISVDSLYFSNNLAKLVTTLKQMRNNRMYLYYSQYIFDAKAEDKTILNSDNTRLARALNENGLHYKSIEYSKNEYTLYENSLKILPRLKEAFINEGNEELYISKIKESKIGIDLYEKGLARRYLYIIEC